MSFSAIDNVLLLEDAEITGMTLLGVNPNTVQRAFSMLVDMGYITPIIGKGNIINRVEESSSMNELEKYINVLLEKGYSLDEIKDVLEKMKIR